MHWCDGRDSFALMWWVWQVNTAVPWREKIWRRSTCSIQKWRNCSRCSAGVANCPCCYLWMQANYGKVCSILTLLWFVYRFYTLATCRYSLEHYRGFGLSVWPSNVKLVVGKPIFTAAARAEEEKDNIADHLRSGALSPSIAEPPGSHPLQIFLQLTMSFFRNFSLPEIVGTQERQYLWQFRNWELMELFPIKSYEFCKNMGMGQGWIHFNGGVVVATHLQFCKSRWACAWFSTQLEHKLGT